MATIVIFTQNFKKNYEQYNYSLKRDLRKGLDMFMRYQVGSLGWNYEEMTRIYEDIRGICIP